MITEALEQLAALLSVEAAPPDSLTAEHRRVIDGILDRAEDEDALFRLARCTQAALDERGDNLRGRYTAAVYQELIGASEEAGKGLVQIARELAKVREFAGTRELLLRAIPLWPDNRVIRLLIATWGYLLDEVDLSDDFTLAERFCPDSPDLLWYEAQSADDQGRAEDAARLACEAVKNYARAKQGERAEEPLLRVLESSEPGVYRSLLAALPTMARAGMRDLLDMTLELANAKINALDLSEDLANNLEKILLKRPAFDHLRPLYVQALSASLGGTTEIASFIGDCGMADPDTPLERALARFHELFAFRPGAYVEHHSFGVGRILSHDPGFLTIDFSDKPAHRMAMEIARRSLRPLPSSCLRVMRFAAPDVIKHEVSDDPVGIVVRALADIGGEAKVRDLRDCLAGGLIHSDDWSSWWKRAREAAVTDARIDTSQTFRQVYRLPDAENGNGMELPPLPQKSGVSGAVSLINRLLKHHPELEERAKDRYAEQLGARALTADPEAALVAMPTLLRWLPERGAEWHKIANRAFRHEPGVAKGATANEQSALLEIGLSGETWREASLSALGSRFPAVRRRAEDELRNRLLEQYDTTIRNLVLESDDWINTRLTMIRSQVAGAPENLLFTPWELLIGIGRLIASDPPPKTVLSAVDLLDAEGRLVALLREIAPDEDATGSLQRVLRELMGSETGPEALTDALAAAGHSDIVGDLTPNGAEEGELDPIAIHFDGRVTLMTRVTYESNTQRIAHLQNELSNVLPKAIAHARSFGDLSENAEYHDAKDRQGIADANLRQLQSQMETARVIEDIEFPADAVTVGTEITVRDTEDGAEQTFWLLGQGDSTQDPNVVNYQAPMGQALIGKRIGQVADFDAGEGERSLQVISLRKRLP